jgi:preprotein translocase subunit SecG
MSAFLVTLHVIVAVLLVGGILLQPGAKGGGLGASFGGGGANSAFGARGSAPFLAKLTYWLAAGFMLTSLAIEVKIVKDNRSVLDKKLVVKTLPAGSTPAAPAPTPIPVPVPPAK